MTATTAGEIEPGQTFIWFSARWEAVRFVWRKVPGYVHPRTFLTARPVGTNYDPSEFPLDEAVLLIEEDLYPCEGCGAVIDEPFGYCSDCEDADELDRLKHEWAHGPGVLG